MQQVVSNIDELRKALPVQVQKCLAFFPGVDRTVSGYEGLMAAQQCLPNNDVRDKFAADIRCWRNLGSAFARPVSDARTRRTTVAHAGLRIGEAPKWHGQAAVARARREDDRANKRKRPCGVRSRRRGDARFGCRGA